MSKITPHLELKCVFLMFIGKWVKFDNLLTGNESKLRDLKTYLVALDLKKHSQGVELNKTNGSDSMIHMKF